MDLSYLNWLHAIAKRSPTLTFGGIKEGCDKRAHWLCEKYSKPESPLKKLWLWTDEPPEGYFDSESPVHDWEPSQNPLSFEMGSIKTGLMYFHVAPCAEIDDQIFVIDPLFTDHVMSAESYLKGFTSGARARVTDIAIFRWEQALDETFEPRRDIGAKIYRALSIRAHFALSRLESTNTPQKNTGPSIKDILTPD